MGGKGSGAWRIVEEINYVEGRPVGRPQRHKDDGIVRKRGRPKRGEEKDRALIIHNLDKMNEVNRLASAKQTIYQAERIYKKYHSDVPNPLNIDDKLLTEEARDIWKYLFFLRGESLEDMHLHSRTLYTPTETCIAFEAYGQYIRSNNFSKTYTGVDGELRVLPIVPNQSNLARWLGVSRHAITNSMREAGDEELNEYRTILADLLSEGAMIGAYNTSMAIFSLKNLCDWADKYDDRPNQKIDTNQTVEEAQRLMASLGYTKQLGEPNEHQED